MVTNLALADALASVSALGTAGRERLLRRLRADQAELLDALESHGAPALPAMLCVVSEALRHAGLSWERVSGERFARAQAALERRLRLHAGMDAVALDAAVTRDIETHAQPWLMAYVHGTMINLGWFGLAGEPRRRRLLAGLALAECAAPRDDPPPR